MPKYEYYTSKDYSSGCSGCKRTIPRNTRILAEMNELGEVQVQYCRRCVIKLKLIDSARFFHIYPNIPLMERNNVCCVVKWKGKKEPISWSVAYLEINNKTKLSNQILVRMAEMELI